VGGKGNPSGNQGRCTEEWSGSKKDTQVGQLGRRTRQALG